MTTRPNYRIEITQRLLLERDGPMLEHGLREFHRQGLLAVPRQESHQPNREFLAERYEMFRKSG